MNEATDATQAALMANALSTPGGLRVVEGRTLNRVTASLALSLLRRGREVQRRGSKALEMPATTVVGITEPEHGLCTLTGRRLNPWTTLAEFPWIVAGRRDVEWLTPYLPRAVDFSDDGRTWRAAYGPRLRAWGGDWMGAPIGVRDQLAFLLAQLQGHPDTRQAVLGIWDPALDLGAESRDIPCTLSLKAEQDPDTCALNLMVVMRSNDLVWGFSGVNVNNFTLLQRLLAELLGTRPGMYTHVGFNLHAYDRHWDMLRRAGEGWDPTPQAPTPPPPFLPSGGELGLEDFTLQCRAALDLVERYRVRAPQERAPWSLGEVYSELASWPMRGAAGTLPSTWLVQWAYFMGLWEWRDRMEPAVALEVLAEIHQESWAVAAASYLARRHRMHLETLDDLARDAAYVHPSAAYALMDDARAAHGAEVPVPGLRAPIPNSPIVEVADG